MKKRAFITQLIVLIMLLVVGIPVIAGLGMIMLLGLFILFGILVVAIGVTAAPFIAEVEPAVAILIQGIPQDTIFYIGMGIVSLTLVLFIIFISGVKHMILFLINMIRRMLEGVVSHG